MLSSSMGNSCIDSPKSLVESQSSKAIHQFEDADSLQNLISIANFEACCKGFFIPTTYDDSTPPSLSTLVLRG